jgi:hypothetical protein
MLQQPKKDWRMTTTKEGKMQTESAAQNKHRKEEVVAHRFVIYSPSTQNTR